MLYVASIDKRSGNKSKGNINWCYCRGITGRALDLCSKADLFREDALDTSVKFVNGCKRVFTDIEAILKRVSKNDAPLHNRFEVPQLEKVLWQFRKGKVDFFRGVLESLKSTILLELAVLN